MTSKKTRKKKHKASHDPGLRIRLLRGDSRKLLKTLPDNSVDSCVCDPPYSLDSIRKRFGKTALTDDTKTSERIRKRADGMARTAAGFMGLKWDTGDTAHDPEFWREVYRVLKPGAFLLAFGGTRTYHRLGCAIECAGFEVRDMVAWLYGQGMPKSHDVSKAIDRSLGVKRTKKIGVKPGHEQFAGRQKAAGVFKSGELGEGFGRPWMHDAEAQDRYSHKFEPVTDAAKQWDGWGTGLKPGLEPICMARKPLSEKTVAANILKWGTGAINIDGCRIGETKRVPGSLSSTPNKIYGKGLGGHAQDGSESGHDPNVGRFPANVVHDGSEDVIAMFPAGAGGGDKRGQCNGRRPAGFGNVGASRGDSEPNAQVYSDTGSAARFFYEAKADKVDRIGSKHPTVKPVSLMRYLCRLVTPPGGTVLDPFAGTGTTGEAAFEEGFKAVLIEREVDYQADVRKRGDTIKQGHPNWLFARLK